MLVVLLFGGCNRPVDELKIISFNIRYNSWNNIDGPNGWPYRKVAVVKMIDEERPAAIGLQEALIDQLQYLDSNLPTYRRIGVGRDDGRRPASSWPSTTTPRDYSCCTTPPAGSA